MGSVPDAVAGGGFLLEPTGTANILIPEMLTDEQRMMKETAEDFVRREVEPRIAEIEEKKPGLMREHPAQGRRSGPAGPRRPRGVRRPGRRQDQLQPDLRGASAAWGRSRSAYGAHVGIGTMPLVLFGTPEQKRKYLPRLATGELIAAYALTEPGSGSDALAAKTKAVLSADGKSYRLTGTKQFITNAALRRSVHGVRQDPDARRREVHRLPGRAQHPRPDRGPEEHKLGIRGSSTCPLILEDCVVPVGERAGDDRPGPQDRLQHPEHRPLEAGRGRRRRGEVLPGAGDQIRHASASSSASRSPSSISSARRSATSPPRSTWASRWPSAPPA